MAAFIVFGLVAIALIFALPRKGMSGLDQHEPGGLSFAVWHSTFRSACIFPTRRSASAVSTPLINPAIICSFASASKREASAIAILSFAALGMFRSRSG